MRLKAVATALCAAVISLSDVSFPAPKAEAAPRYGVSGLGSNLHRRFVLKQAAQRASRGQAVRNRAIVWFAQPSFRRVGPSAAYYRRR